MRMTLPAELSNDARTKRVFTALENRFLLYRSDNSMFRTKENNYELKSLKACFWLYNNAGRPI